MLFALDHNNQRVYIEETKSNQNYYCPYCGEELIVRKGDVRVHHFAHKNRECIDTWQKDGSYNMSLWHNEWQNCFPKINQEIKLSQGNIMHRADVLVNRTVIEFQRSSISINNFNNRNQFYTQLGYRVVWLFDLRDVYKDNKLSITKKENRLYFKWSNPLKTFNRMSLTNHNIEIYFQLFDEEQSIVRVLEVSNEGFSYFCTSDYMNKNDFLSNVGLKNGKCLVPYIGNEINDKQYELFKEKYNIKLNSEQDRAVLTTEGNTLLLAVPGSGKTTVLISRIAHLIINKKVNPDDILALSFNKAIALEMEERFNNIFSKDITGKVSFKTINSFCNSIINEYEHRRVISESRQKEIVKEVLRENGKDESELMEAISTISYIKNMMLSVEEIENLKYVDIYKHYIFALNKSNFMDYDDQLMIAYEYLMNNFNIVKKYKYILIDEAQDLTKLQHEIIKLISIDSNVFFVGDEDQSIYGFRGAFPNGLLNFKYDYSNPYILIMNKNYRSTPQIVKLSNDFITKNSGRYNKNMISMRDNGENVRLINVKTPYEQYEKTIEYCKNVKAPTAILFRENQTAIALIDLLLRNNVQFSYTNKNVNFFNSKLVNQIKAYFSLVVNKHDYKSLSLIVNKKIYYIKEKQLKYCINDMKKGIPLDEALMKQMEYEPSKYKNRIPNFLELLKRLSIISVSDALDMLYRIGIKEYIQENNIDLNTFNVLLSIAKKEKDIKSFLARLAYLQKVILNNNMPESNILLTTIHSSKGLEFDTVFFVDTYDNYFLIEENDNKRKDSESELMESRRLFYVGITRTKNNLFLFNIKDKENTYINELFPNETVNKNQKLEKVNTVKLDKVEQPKNFQNNKTSSLVDTKIDTEKVLEITRNKRFNEVISQIDQNDYEVFDSYGIRWIKCIRCGEIKEIKYFGSYGGKDKNLGVCNECYKSRR